jgi:hypothetical protein
MTREKQHRRTAVRRAISAVTVFLVFVPNASAESFAEQLNPTGHPIGGGPGYRDIKSRAAANMTVATRRELVDALRKAKAGMTIYVADQAVIDMTGADDQAIPGGVTLASGRGWDGSQGALLFSNTLTDGARFLPLFKTGGKGVRITGLRLRGPFGEVGDHHYDQIKIANGIKADHENLEVDNCELWAWNKWAIDLAVAGGAHIHHNHIHHTRRWGYGYGVWVRGGGKAIIEANLFDFCRHHIGSGAQATSSYEARYNICLYHDVQPSFDRHGSPAKAGFATLIHHNEFRNPDYAAILLRGNPLNKAHFHHNWFAHADRKTAIINQATKRKTVHIQDNVYGGASRQFHPQAIATATPAQGTAPLKVRFNASGSKDREGGRIVRHRWKFGDTADSVGPQAYAPTATYTFNDPGRYRVALYASNEHGVPGVTWIPVTVHPSQPGYVLSAWVKDSYYGPLKGHLRKQILIDGQTIWEDDLEGDEGGWQHLVLNVDRWVEGKKEIELSFRLNAQQQITDPQKQIVESYYYVDDVHLFGGKVINGDFETDQGWTYHQQPQGQSGFGMYIAHYWSGEARSGKRCYVIGAGYNRKLPAGAICEVKQTIAIQKKPQAKKRP